MKDASPRGGKTFYMEGMQYYPPNKGELSQEENYG
jgi:hypothetical protein